MQEQIERVLISRDRIAKRVAELAKAITADHTATGPGESAEVAIVAVLTGAMIFCADLIREIPMAMKIGLLTVSSYPGATVSSIGATLTGKQIGDIRGRHVVLVDDIFDSGGTVRLIVPVLREAGAASVKTCCLLRKNRPSTRDVVLDYVGFDIPDEFVVGYGLDYNDYYRNLPDIVTLKGHVFAGAGAAEGKTDRSAR